MIDLRDASLIDFLPESISSDPEIIALSLAIDPELRDVGAAIIEAVILPRIADLEEPILNELAWAFNLNSLQIWDVATIEGKRALLVNIFQIRKKSGTRFAVRRVFDLMSVVGEVVEWFEEGAAPYTYRLRIFVDQVGITLSQQTQISELTHRFEPTRCQLSEFAVESDRAATVVVRSAVTSGRHSTIQFWDQEPIV
jgi:phage tail P2-like protein